MDYLKQTIPEPNTGCWLWLGSLNKDGYGVSRRAGLRGLAHRFSYQAAGGTIDSGLELDHLCRVRCCVNPDHLEPVTPLENTRRSIRARLREGSLDAAATDTHCKHGHRFDEVGRYVRVAHGVACMECARISRRKYDRAGRAAIRLARGASVLA